MIKRLLSLLVLFLLALLLSGPVVQAQGFEFWEMTNWPIFQYIDENQETFLLVPTGVDIVVREVDLPTHDGLLPVTAEWDIEIAGSTPLGSGVRFDVLVKTSNASASNESGWQMVAPDVLMPRGFSSGLVTLPIPALIYLDAERPYLRAIRLVAHLSGSAAEFCFPACDASIDMIRLVGAPPLVPTSTPTPTATNTPTATATPTASLWCEGLNDQKDVYSFAGSMDGWTLNFGTASGSGVVPALSGGTYALYVSKSYNGVSVSGVRYHYSVSVNKQLLVYDGIPDFTNIVANIAINSELDPAINFTPRTVAGNLFMVNESSSPSAVLTGVDICRYVPITTSTPTSTATPTATALTCSPPTPGPGTATITPTATAGAGTSTAVPLPTCLPPSTPTITPTVTSTSTPSRTPTPLGSITPLPLPPPGGTLPAPGGGTPGAPQIVPTPGPGVFPTVVMSDPFGDAVSPCTVVPSVNFLSTNYICPSYQFPAWPGFTIQLWVYFSYLVQSLIALWGAATCLLGSMFNYTLWFYSIFHINYHWLSYLWCMMSELLRLLGLFLSRVWNMITGLLLAVTAEGEAAPIFLGVSVALITETFVNLLSNTYVRVIFDVILAVISLTMWRQIARNLVGASTNE